MELSHLRSLLAPPLVALFALLTLCVIVVQTPPSTGFKVPLPRLHHHRDQSSCDGRWEFIQLLDDGRTKINDDEITKGELAPLISNIMASRAERVVYVVPSSGIPYSRLVETLSSLKTAVRDIHIGVLSGKVRDAYMKPRLISANRLSLSYSPCDIEWPTAEF
jgi:biopolymer transport protein ExbD